MAENEILIRAHLDIHSTEKNISEEDIPKLNVALANDARARVKITAGLDFSKTKQLINSQLATIGKDIKIEVGNINIGSVQNAAAQVKNSMNAIMGSMSSVSGNGLFSDNFSKSFANTKNALELAKQEFSQLNNVASVTGNWIKGMNNTLTGFTVNVTSTSGAIENFKYSLEEIDKVKSFFYQGSRGADSGILKLAQDIENARIKYTTELSRFKSENASIMSGLTLPIKEFEDKLNSLGKGVGVNEIVNQFKLLEMSANAISKNLVPVDSSFNRKDNAVNNYKAMDATLQKLATDYDNLIVKNTELGTQITSAKEKLSQLQQVESLLGTNATWAQGYREVSAEIKAITTEMKLAQNAETADKGSTAQQQLHYYSKIRQELIIQQNLKKKLINAGEEESKVINYQIKLAANRQKYAEEQITKKNLYNQALFTENNELTEIFNKQNAINAARQRDKTNTTASTLATDISLAESNLATLEQRWQRQGILVGEFKAKVEGLKTELNQVGNVKGLENYSANLKRITDEATRMKAQLSSQRGLEKTVQQVEILTNRINAFERVNTRALPKFGSQLDALKVKLQDINSRLAIGDTTAIADYQKVSRELQSVTAQVSAAGKMGDTLSVKIGNAIKKFGSWLTVTSFIMYTVRAIRDMVKAVVEIDTAMVSLKKVTEATDAEFANFLTNAAKSAKELGAAITDVIDATAEFSRLGYGLPDAETLGRIAILYQNVGDGITAKESSQSIISTMKAFNIEADKAEEIIDKFNEVGNNFSISSAGIGNALQRSAAALAEANNDLSQSVALQVGANNVIQDPDVVGTMWKTVAMRIRGATSELEEAGLETEGMVESTSQLRDIVKGMTGFDIMLDENTFKSTYDVVIGIGEQWDKLSDIDQASLLEKLAGKRQGNALAAALSNIDDIQAAYKTAEESAGSAMKEQMEYQKGVQYSLDVFKAAFQSFSNTVFNSDTFKAMIDSSTEFLGVLEKIVDTIGIIPTILGGVGIAKALKNIGLFSKSTRTDFVNFAKSLSLLDQTSIGTYQAIDNMGKAISTLTPQQMALAISTKGLSLEQAKLVLRAAEAGTVVREEVLATAGLIPAQQAAGVSTGVLSLYFKGLATSILGSVKAIKAFLLTTPVGWVVMATAAIAVLVTGINAYNKSVNEGITKANENAEAVQDEIEALDDYKDKVEELKLSLDKGNLSEEEAYDARKQLITIQDELVDKYGLEKGAIDLVNGGLQEQIDLLDEATQKSASEWIYSNRGEIENAEDKVENRKGYHSQIKFPVFRDTGDLISELYENKFGSYGTENTFDIDINDSTVDEAIAKYQELYDFVQKYRDNNKIALSQTQSGIENIDKILSLISQDINKINSEEYQAAKKLYDTATQNLLISDVDYRNIYSDLIVAQKEYQDAVASGNEQTMADSLEKMSASKDKFTQALNDGVIVDTGVENWFKKFYEDFEAESGRYQFEIDVEANTKNIETGIKIALASLGKENVTKTDVLNLEFSDVPQQQQAWNSLNYVAEQYSTTVEELIPVLQKLGYVQDGTEASTTEYRQSLEEIDEAYEEISKASKEYVSIQKDITSAVDEQKEHGELSADTIQKLVEAGYATALSYDEQTGAVTLNKQAVADLNKQKEAGYKLDIATQKLELEEQISNITEELVNFTQQYASANKERRKELEYLYEKKNILEGKYDGLNGLEASLSAPTWEKTDTNSKTAFELEYDTLKYYYDKGIIKAEEYYDKLEALNNKYNSGADKLEDYRKYDLEIYNGRVKIIEDLLSKEKEATEETKDSLSDMFDDRKEYYEDIKTQITDAYDAEIDAIDKVIEAKKKETDEIEKQKSLTEALTKLEDTRNQRKKLTFTGGGLLYTKDESAIKDAQEEVDKIKSDIEVSSLEEQKSKLETDKSTSTEYLDVLIKSVDEQKNEVLKRFDTLLALVEGVKVDNDDVAMYEKNKNATANDYLNLNKTTENGLTKIDGKVVNDGSDAYKAYAMENAKKYFSDKFGVNLDDVQSKITGKLMPNKFSMTPEGLKAYEAGLSNIYNKSYNADNASTLIINGLTISGQEADDIRKALLNCVQIAKQFGSKK